MRLALSCLIPATLLAACAAGPRASLEDRTLPFSCQDVVAIGRLKNGSFQPVSIPDDILGHGWVSASLNVRRVVKGPKLAPVVPVRYFAHAELIENHDFMLVLSRTDDGVYQIKARQLMSLRPLLSDRCE